VQGLTDADVRYFLDVVRSRIAPVLDITPEVLTHWNAIDLTTGCLLPVSEHVWSRSQDRQTLRPYLALALEILNNVDLPCCGMTSPWDFGVDVEGEYAEALLAAQREVNGRTFTWYFLHADGASRHVTPRLPIVRPEAAEAVVSIVCCDTQDFGRDVWTGGTPHPDELISADGQSGRLAHVLAAGGPGAFHTHWQTLFSHGTRSGLHGLREVARRVEEHFGDRIIWTRCSDLAMYAAAAATVRITTIAETVIAEVNRPTTFDIAAPFACPRFTLSLALDASLRAVAIDDELLDRVSGLADLREGSYAASDTRLYVCWPLRDGQRLDLDIQSV